MSQKTSHTMTLEQLEQYVAQLSPQEQLKLVAYISEHLSALPLVVLAKENEEKEQARQERLAKVDAWLAECEKVAELWEGEFDSAADLRCIRNER